MALGLGRRYTVFVGGMEVNDHLLKRREAKIFAEYWRQEGYDDVGIERLSCRRYKKMTGKK